MSINSLIRLEAVSKNFTTDDMETRALSNVHLDIARGEFLSIEGPSGSGKTTLLSVLGLLESPDSGIYALAGTSVEGLSALEAARVRNQKIGFVFQSFNLIGDLSVSENVELPLIYRNTRSGERPRLVEAALERVGMSHRAKHMPSQLSGGQQQRVAVARAIVGEPLILLADEPTGNLDSHNGDIVMGLLRELNTGGTTICMVTHNPEYARQASRTVNLFDGCIVREQRYGGSAVEPHSHDPSGEKPNATDAR